MHLATTRSVVFHGLYGGVLALLIVSFLIHSVMVRSVPLIILANVALFFHVLYLMKLTQVLRNRRRDRLYIQVKDELWRVLNIILPENGKVHIESDDVNVRITREHKSKFREFFSVCQFDEEDFVYNSENLTHIAVTPIRFYYLSKNVLAVDLRHAATVTRVAKASDSSELEYSYDPVIETSQKQSKKAHKELPVELFYASTEEMKELADLLSRHGIGTAS